MMESRRAFVVGAVAAGCGELAGCAAGGASKGATKEGSGYEGAGYDEVVARQRAPIVGGGGGGAGGDGGRNEDLVEFARYATLAPSGHNTQPWRFVLRETGMSILPDFGRRTPVVDPDDHHLFVSLGCAAENFLIAAAAGGRPGEMTFRDDGEGRVEVDLAHGAARRDELFEAIPAAQSTRSNYNGRAVPAETIKRLEAAAKVDGVAVVVLTEARARETVLDYVVRGNTDQMEDEAFVNELRAWIRFNPAQALAMGDGLYSGCSGQPTVPTWIGTRMFSRFFKKDAENARYRAQLRSSAGVAVFVGDRADREHWVKVGRSFERFRLQATALGLRHALVNQPVEVPGVRSAFARWLGIGDVRPDLVVRFGWAPAMPMSVRRPLRSVLVARG